MDWSMNNYVLKRIFCSFASIRAFVPERGGDYFEFVFVQIENYMRPLGSYAGNINAI